MKQLMENWRKYLEEGGEQRYLYHGTSSEFAQDMIDNYTSVETYWGDFYTARDYAEGHDNPIVIKVPLENIMGEIEPNETLVQSYQENSPEDLEVWTNSGQTALDSLEIFGSVILPSGVLLKGATIHEDSF